MADIESLMKELNLDLEEEAAPEQPQDEVENLLKELNVNPNEVVIPSRAPTSGPGPRGASSGPGPRGVFSGPGPRGVSSGPGPRGVSSGPGPRGVSSGPGPRGAASGPGPRGAASGPGPRAPLTDPQGNPIQFKGPTCKRCGEPITGQHIAAFDAHFHPDCFVCIHCGKKFDQGKFFEYEGEAYCEEDYRTLFAPKCYTCKGSIDSQVVNLEGKYWHPHHFNCVHCGINLAGKAYRFYKDEVYCTTCIGTVKTTGSTASQTCGRCKLPIVGEAINYKGLPMHPHHFNCQECKKELKASEFNEWEGAWYCNEDYEKLLGKICAGCNKPIVGRSVQALGKLWHPEHFICAVCSAPLGSSKYYVKNDKAYDEQHYTQLFGKICAHCDKPVLNPITFLENHYHAEHFLCTACNLPFKKGEKPNEFEGKPIHLDCWNKLPNEVKKRILKKREAEKKEMEKKKKEEKKKQKGK